MASIIVRNLDDGVKAKLAERARQNGVSMEAEVRRILSESVGDRNAGQALLDTLSETGGFPEFTIPAREYDDDRVPFS